MHPKSLLLRVFNSPYHESKVCLVKKKKNQIIQKYIQSQFRPVPHTHSLPPEAATLNRLVYIPLVTWISTTQSSQSVLV